MSGYFEFSETESGRYALAFGGASFYDVKDIVKAGGARYEPNERHWTAPKRCAQQILQAVQATLGSTLDYRGDVGKLTENGKVRYKQSLQEFPDIFEKHPPLGQYQKEDAIAMATAGRYLNGNDCGMGKTYTTIKAMELLFLNKKVDRVFVVTVLSVMQNWKTEILNFSSLFQEDEVVIWDSSDKEKYSNLKESKAKVIICSYAAWMHITRYYYEKSHPNWKKVKGEKFPKFRSPVVNFGEWGSSRLLILDESHRVKDGKSEWTRAIRVHKDFFEYRFLLTGTPATKGVENFYSQLDVMDESLLGMSYVEFLKWVAVIGTAYSSVAVVRYKAKEVAEFMEQISGCYCRRLRKDYLNLPEFYRKKIYVPLDGMQKSIYRLCVNSVLNKIVEEEGAIDLRQVLNRAPYVIQALQNPELLLNFGDVKIMQRDYDTLEKMIKSFKFTDMLKVKYLDDLLAELWREEPEKRVVVWDIHPKTLERLGEHYAKYDPLVIHGATKDRELVVEKFRQDTKRKLLLANPAVLGTGMNLQFLSTAVYFTRSYSVVEQIQADGRIVRPGMREDAYSYTLVYSDSQESAQDVILESGLSLNNALKTWNLGMRETLEKLFGVAS